jgi:hypothetical protein
LQLLDVFQVRSSASGERLYFAAVDRALALQASLFDSKSRDVTEEEEYTILSFLREYMADASDNSRKFDNAKLVMEAIYDPDKSNIDVPTQVKRFGYGGSFFKGALGTSEG